MPDHLPDVYTDFRSRFPAVANAQDALAATIDGAGPLDERSVRLVKLGISIGRLSEGAVRSNARKALNAGATPEELRQAALCAITTAGFPVAIAALGWIDEVLTPGT